VEWLLLQAGIILLLPRPPPSLRTLLPLPHPTTILPLPRTTPTSLNHPRHSVGSIQTVVNSQVLAAVDMDNIRVLQHTHLHMELDIHHTKLNLMPVQQVQSVDIKQRVHLQQEVTSSRAQQGGLLPLHPDIKLRQANGTGWPRVATNSRATIAVEFIFTLP